MTLKILKRYFSAVKLDGITADLSGGPGNLPGLFYLIVYENGQCTKTDTFVK